MSSNSFYGNDVEVLGSSVVSTVHHRTYRQTKRDTELGSRRSLLSCSVHISIYIAIGLLKGEHAHIALSIKGAYASQKYCTLSCLLIDRSSGQGHKNSSTVYSSYIRSHPDTPMYADTLLQVFHRQWRVIKHGGHHEHVCLIVALNDLQHTKRSNHDLQNYSHTLNMHSVKSSCSSACGLQ